MNNSIRPEDMQLGKCYRVTVEGYLGGNGWIKGTALYPTLDASRRLNGGISTRIMDGKHLESATRIEEIGGEQ